MCKLLLLLPFFCLAASGARAQSDDAWQVTASVVVTHQRASAAYVQRETETSADMLLQRRVGHGQWGVHFEAVSTLTGGGVYAWLPEANADAGTALDAQGRGRLQLSELHYGHDLRPGRRITLGLLDVSGFFEQSRIASDESTQFLGAPFTGNPTIGFPDYTLGLVYEQALEGGWMFRTAITGSNGLADNPRRSYAELKELDAAGKGVFAIGAISWRNASWLGRLTAWSQTADHDALDGGSTGRHNAGLALLAGYRDGAHAFNLRLGQARERVSEAAAFASLAYQYRFGAQVLGAGTARTRLSPFEPDAALGDTTQHEIYLRRTLWTGVFLTVDLQHIENGGFGRLPETRQRGITVYGLRLTWLYP